jgi:hypothetical protein
LERIHIQTGATEKVTITLGPNTFETFNEKTNELSPKAGKYIIMVGPSSRGEDLDLNRIPIELKEKDIPSAL